MRTIERSSAFKRDYKRIKATPRYSKNLDLLISGVLEFLLADEPLPGRNRDHVLSGDWDGYRECHIKPDLLLIYRKPDKHALRACARITSLFRAHFGLIFGRFVFQKNAYIERLCAHFSEKQNIQI